MGPATRLALFMAILLAATVVLWIGTSGSRPLRTRVVAVLLAMLLSGLAPAILGTMPR